MGKIKTFNLELEKEFLKCSYKVLIYYLKIITLCNNRPFPEAGFETKRRAMQGKKIDDGVKLQTPGSMFNLLLNFSQGQLWL